ncbi:uncharacterized protein M6B38_171190 [Iris pallida]|uniref:Cytochrome c-552/DMSO reductase-like haem-binding domain-containing protein n=1 Tax=Iris pallida TaxID=29817 RepID=A0AAX6EVE4_IRIPA|nr:uncharacterized protein M6B38_171190 [Iris pallida]
MPKVVISLQVKYSNTSATSSFAASARTRIFSLSLPLSTPIPRRSISNSTPAEMLRLALISAILLVSAVRPAAPHEHHGEESEGSCEMGPDARLVAEYVPGLVTVDGHADEWAEVEGPELDILPALDPHEDKAYAGGKMTVKASHDGNNVFFMLQIAGDYAYSKGENVKCPSVALMFQVGENASYVNMGGCKDMPGTCTSKSCRGHEVDIMHFSIGNAIPGRLYGGNSLDNGDGNGGDRFGHLVDVYAWNPHCRYLDGKTQSGNTSNGQNDWHGAWWHDSLTFHSGFTEDDSPYAEGGKKGTYYFEFSRPLRTMDRFQQASFFLHNGCPVCNWSAEQGSCCLLVPDRWETMVWVSALLS